MNRHEIRTLAEDLIDRLIDLLDALDGDPDLEIETDVDIAPVSLQSADRVPSKRLARRRAA